MLNSPKNLAGSSDFLESCHCGIASQLVETPGNHCSLPAKKYSVRETSNVTEMASDIRRWMNTMILNPICLFFFLNMMKNLLCFSIPGSGKWPAPSQVLNCKVLLAILGTLRRLISRATWNFLMERSVPCCSYTLWHVFCTQVRKVWKCIRQDLECTAMLVTLWGLGLGAAKSCDDQSYHDSSCGGHEARFAVEPVSERNSYYWLLS